MAKKKANIMQWVFGLGLAIMMVFLVTLATTTFMPEPNYNDYCDMSKNLSPNEYLVCGQEYDKASQSYNFTVFMIFSLLGMGLVIGSLFISMTFLEVATLFSGFILMIMGLVENFDNKQQALLSTVLIIALLVFVGYTKLKVK